MELESLTSNGFITPKDARSAAPARPPMGGSAPQERAPPHKAGASPAAVRTAAEADAQATSSTLPPVGVDGGTNPVVSQLAALHTQLDATASLIEALLFPRAGPATRAAQEVVQELQAEEEGAQGGLAAPPPPAALLAALHRSQAHATELAGELAQARELIAAHDRAAEEHAGQLAAACALVEANEEVLRAGRDLRERAQREGWGGEEAEEGGEGDRPPKRAREGAALPSPPPEQGSELVRRASLAAAALKAAREEAREKATAVAVQHAMALQTLKREHAAELAAARSGHT